MSAVHFANHQEECSFSIKETQTAEAVPMTILDFEVHFFPHFGLVSFWLQMTMLSSVKHLTFFL